MTTNWQKDNLEEIKCYNALAKIHEGEYSKLKKEFENHNSWTKAFQKNPNKSNIDKNKEFENLEKSGIKLILMKDPLFPDNLKEIPWPPFAIYLKGNEKCLKDFILGVVGTRKASELGKKISKEFSKKLSEINITIASGLALGIDTEAHKGTLEANYSTVAVLAQGLDSVYPKINHNLAQSILKNNGALVSEYPLNSPAFPKRFIERNRIVSGLSKGIIVIEAPASSGSLQTAKFALDQNRDIFVVPGPINNLNYQGSNELIKAGANLVTEIEDIIKFYDLEFISNPKNTKEMANLDKDKKEVYDALSNQGRKLTAEEISELLKKPLEKVLISLAELEMKNLIKEEIGKYYLWN